MYIGSCLFHTACRKLWTRGLDLAKCAMTGEQAVKKATELMNLGRELADAMKSSDFTQAQDVDNLTKKLSAVSLFLDVAEHIPDSQKEVENAMRELVAEIKELCDQKAPVNKFDDLATWLDQQWVDKEGSFRLTKSDELANVMPSLEFRGLMIGHDLPLHYRTCQSQFVSFCLVCKMTWARESL